MSPGELRAPTPIDVEQQAERLRQEAETFNQLLGQDAQWFKLRLWTGIVSLVMFPAIFAFCVWIIRNASQFDPKIVVAASGALFVDILGMVTAAWKILLNPQSQGQLKPITDKVTLVSNGHPHFFPDAAVPGNSEKSLAETPQPKKRRASNKGMP